MNSNQKKYDISGLKYRSSRYIKQNAFTLVEVVTALTILGILSSSVLIVIDRCMTSVAESNQRMRAFEVARENMEALLSKDTVTETAEFGTSQKYPDINWQTIVETFYEPITARMWVRGTCSATYLDTEDKTSKVELTHWLTGLTREQLLQILLQQEGELLEENLIATIEQAAEYAGVDTETIDEWLLNGMLTTEDGFFVKSNLELYMNTNGNPSDVETKQQIESNSDLELLKLRQTMERLQDQIDPQTGLTYSEIDQMDISQIWETLQNQK
ncbi:type II secretion system protein [Planctomycetota bacterium]